MKSYKTLLQISFVLFIVGMQNFKAQNTGEYLKGIETLTKGDTTKAADYFESSTKRNKDAESYWELAKINNNINTLNSLMKARLLIQEAIKKDEKNIEYRLLFGLLLEKLFKVNFFDKDARSRAFLVYEDILKIKFETPKAHFRLAELYKEDYYEFVNSVYLNDKEIDYKFNNKDPYTRDVQREYYNEFLNSLMLDDQVTKQDYNVIAKTFWDNSVSHFYNVIKYDSMSYTTYKNLAMLYDFNGMHSEGIDVVKSGLKCFPENDSLYLELAYLYYKNKNFEESDSLFNKSFTLLDKEQVDIFKNKTVQYLFDTNLQKSFTRFADSQKEVFIKKYWDIKEPLNYTSYNERELEHYARVYFVNYHFTVADLKEIGWQTDKGNIVIRYGIPNNYRRIRPDHSAGGIKATSMKTFLDPSARITVMTPKSEIWDYGDKIFSFVDLTNNMNYKLITKSSLTSNYKLPFYNDSYEQSSELQKTEPENYTPKFEGPLFTVPYNALQLKGENGNTDLYISYAVNAKDGLIEGEKFKFNHKMVLLPLDNYFNKITEKKEDITYLESCNKVSTEDKVMYVNSAELKLKSQQINLAFELIRESDKGVSSNHGKINIKNFTGNNLLISDVILSENVNFRDENIGTIQRGNYKILPNPTRTFNEENKPFIYYEIYNLKKGENNLTSFEQEITIREVEEENELGNIVNSLLDVIGFDSKGNEITLSSNYSTIETNPQIYLQLDLSDYDPGEYLITVSIKDKITGEKTNSEVKINWL